MRLKTASILALGIALTIPLSANAASSERARRHVPNHHRIVVTHAAALASTRPAFGGKETDGLSRNPNDCATYGCIDNGGG